MQTILALDNTFINFQLPKIPIVNTWAHIAVWGDKDLLLRLLLLIFYTAVSIPSNALRSADLTCIRDLVGEYNLVRV